MCKLRNSVKKVFITDFFAFVSDGKSDKVIREVDQQDHTGPLSVDSSYMSVPTPQLDQAAEEVGLTSRTTEFPGINIHVYVVSVWWKYMYLTDLSLL